ncbi:MAG: PKD domain-containing protein [Cyclobacteriaceae bacterium]
MRLIGIGMYLIFIMSNDVLGTAGYRFIPNAGQWDTQVQYRAQVPGGQLYIMDGALRYVFYDRSRLLYKQSDQAPNIMGVSRMVNNDLFDLHAFDMVFEGANKNATIQHEQSYPEKYNFFIGNNPLKWATDQFSYASLNITALYDGINLKIYNGETGLKYDLVVKPGADPNQIKLSYNGAEQVSIKDGDLLIETSLNTVTEKAPYAYQIIDGKEIAVSCKFRSEGGNVYFDLPDGYDSSYTLIIDPIIIFSTFSGSFADNWGFTAAPSENGDLYSGGIVSGVGFPTTVGAYQRNFSGVWDIGILKYDSTGSELLYATYLGGSQSEVPQSLIEDHDGNLVILGSTSSLNFPVTDGAYQSTYGGGQFAEVISGVNYANGSDIYIAKLSANGNELLASTYIGGSGNDGILIPERPLTVNYGDQFRSDVIVDEANNIYIASHTASSDFPVVNAFQSEYGGGFNDGIVASLSSDLSEVYWSSYVGGEGMDALFSIKINPLNEVYVAGGTTSMNLSVDAAAHKPSKAGSTDIDGFIYKISADGTSVQHSTYVGTNSYDQVYFLELYDDQVYVLGQTMGDYPVSEAVYSNSNSSQFIHCLNAELTETIFSTVFGSGRPTPDISPTAFMVNECGNIFVSGWGGDLQSDSNLYIGGDTGGLPVTEDAFQSTTDRNDFYLMVLLEGAKELLYGTFFGGRFVNEHVDGGTSRFDKKGIVYHAVCAGCGGNSVFPTTPGVWSRTNNSSNCNNAAFKFDMAALKADFTTDNKEFTRPGITSGCFPLEIVFLNRSFGGRDFLWDFGEGTTSTQKDSIQITYFDPGIYDVSLTVRDINTCIREDIAYGSIQVYEGLFTVDGSTEICFGDETQLQAGGAVEFHWSPQEGLSGSNIPNPTASPTATTTYTVNMIDQNGCEYEDDVEVIVVPEIIADFEFRYEVECFGAPVFEFENLSTGAESYIWDFGDGNITEELNPIHVYEETGNYQVTLEAITKACNNIKTMSIFSAVTFIPNVISPNNDGKNDSFELIVTDPASLKIYNRWGRQVYESNEYNNDWDAEGLSDGVYYYEAIVDEDHVCNGWINVIR